VISKKTVEEIKFAAKIEEVVGDFVTLKRQGQGYVGICPFHNDSNPSMHVSPRLGIYHCFVCDAKGNAINFLMEHAKMSYPEALEYLAKKYSITLEFDRPETPEEKKLRSEKDSLFIVNEFAEKYFMDQLRNSEEGRLMGLSYFKERGFKDATIDKFHLGYCPGGWDSFTQYALKQGYQEEFLLKLGLTKKSESGKLFDFYRGRVIFPIHNHTGKVIGFGGRILKKDEKIAKYFNSPENEIYHKKETLYDIYLAKKAIRQKDNVYLVEGYTDVISMFESGIENVVASSGTSLTPEQVKILSSQTRNITVLYDGDAAGIKASLRGIDMLLAQGLNVKVCLLPDGEDPDSFAKKHRDSELIEYLETHTTDFLLFKADILSKEAGNDPMKRANMVSEMITSIAAVRDNIARAFYVKECARMFELPETTLNAELKRKVWKKLNEEQRKNTPEAPEQPATDTITVPVERSAPEQEKPAVDLLYEAEKNVVLLLLKYGLYEINVTDAQNPEQGTQKRVDQFVFDDLFNDGIVLQNPLLNKIYAHYAEVAEILMDQDDIKRTFILSEDPEESQFAIQYLDSDEPQYSERWEKRYDIYTHTIRNNVFILQQEVQNIILNLKLRLVEQRMAELQKDITQEGNTEEDTIMLMQQLQLCVKSRSDIAHRLKIVVSK